MTATNKTSHYYFIINILKATTVQYVMGKFPASATRPKERDPTLSYTCFEGNNPFSLPAYNRLEIVAEALRYQYYLSIIITFLFANQTLGTAFSPWLTNF
jgi:hypothetical protein